MRQMQPFPHGKTPITFVVGAQWGDEGKGAITDRLVAECGIELVLRAQGGPNAGHTVCNEYGKFALHGLPSGIFTPGVKNVICQGTVVNPISLVAEMQEVMAISDNRVTFDPKSLQISELAHLIMPYHRTLDVLSESNLGRNQIGSTKQGISPAYAHKAARIGIQAGYLRDLSKLRKLLVLHQKAIDADLAKYGAPPLHINQVIKELQPAARILAPYIRPVHNLLAQAMQHEQSILIEGQLGVMRDLDQGTYPFVTSSGTGPMGLWAAAGLPFHPNLGQARVIGVTKPYTTSVGAGPFPVGEKRGIGLYLRKHGQEFGATTGRPRDCGWLDLVALRYAVCVGGFTELALTKLDILDRLRELRICTCYKINGKVVHEIDSVMDIHQAKPVYNSYPGWYHPELPPNPVASSRVYNDLPQNAKDFVTLIERNVGIPISIISTGAGRDYRIFR